MKGFINLIKPEGMSSAYAVSQVKKKFNITCGHMGTLDPMASGVLPVGIDKTSRMFDYLLDKTKMYVAEFEFGYGLSLSAVESIENDVVIYVMNRNIIAPAEAKVYNLQGIETGRENVAPGIYVVTYQNQVTKLHVR